MKVGYYSSYDRGLQCLLQIWPQIKEAVPTAELHIYYGWNTFDSMHKSNPQMMQWKFKMLSLMNQDGVTEHGRVSHQELAKAMKGIDVWAYPTMFTEISCITAMKAQLAGNYPVVNAVAALDETVQFGTKLHLDNLYENEDQQKAFADAVIAALEFDNDPHDGQEWVKSIYSWESIAKQWMDVCRVVQE